MMQMGDPHCPTPFSASVSCGSDTSSGGYAML